MPPPPGRRGRARAVLAAAVSAMVVVVVVGGLAPALAAPKPGAPGGGPAAGATASTGTATSTRVMPLPKGSYRLSATFGQAGSMWSSGYHTGQDFSASQGTAVLAATDGLVVFAGSGGRYGSLIEIAHSDGVQTWYAHLSVIGVRVGARVRAGDRIGSVGSTGNSTGPHLHFEVRLAGRAVDPMPWLGGATPVADPGLVVAGADPSRAADLRAQLVEAEAVRSRAEAHAADLRGQAEVVGRQVEEAERVAESARRDLLAYAREAYKVGGGVDPEWLLQVDAWSSGDFAEFTDRQVFLDYSHGSQSQRLAAAVDSRRRVVVLRDENQRLLSEADAALAEADRRMEVIEAQLEAESWSWAAEGQWDGVVPEGGTPSAREAVRFALAQVGKPYSLGSPNGPGSYACNGLVWRAWREAGSKWQVQVAHDQATNRQWVVPVPAGEEQPGDLVFFRIGNGTDSRANAIDHVGMVVNQGSGSFVHASSPRTGVEVNNYRTSSFYRDTVAMFGRVVGADPARAPRPASR